MSRAEQIMEKISDRFGADKTTTKENLNDLKELRSIIDISIEALTNEINERS